MSAEGENGKTPQLEKDEKDVSATDGVESDKKAVMNSPEKKDDAKANDEEKKEDLKNSEEKKENSKDARADGKGEKDESKNDVKEDKKEIEKNKKDSDKNKKEKADKEDSEKDEELDEEEDAQDDKEDGDEDEEEDDEADKKTKKPTPKKRAVQKKNESKNEADEDFGGTELGEIPRIDASISRFKNDDLKMLHKLLYKSPIKTQLLKKNIRKFAGFDFKKSSEEYRDKISSMGDYEIKQLRVICEMLDLEKKGGRDEVAERILDFLIEPKDSGRTSSGGRPRRSAAVKANNRGYSDEDYSSDERSAPRAKRNAGRRGNLKDETSSEGSDEDFQPSDDSEEEKPRPKRGRANMGRRKKEESDEEEASEVDSEESEDSDEPRSKRKKVANNKVAKGRGGATAPRRGRGRPAATPTKGKEPPRRGRKKQQETSEEEEESEAHDDASSSEDEPLAKKSAKNPTPPTDDEIKTYVKEILDGANLEEITMKTVCKQVYAHYPDFDLTHKKDYIKNTVKSLIST